MNLKVLNAMFEKHFTIIHDLSVRIEIASRTLQERSRMVEAKANDSSYEEVFASAQLLLFDLLIQVEKVDESVRDASEWLHQMMGAGLLFDAPLTHQVRATITGLHFKLTEQSALAHSAVRDASEAVNKAGRKRA